MLKTIHQLPLITTFASGTTLSYCVCSISRHSLNGIVLPIGRHNQRRPFYNSFPLPTPALGAHLSFSPSRSTTHSSMKFAHRITGSTTIRVCTPRIQ
ncbi:unnamed protein product [Ceratitis capitata]|uniref:(Mediterranean fruit fly) hypothetical protein n=1 Tax=Ceratitis capitata TaxID=7213 RepID=A0A811UUK4_CERCA|nr:unnamed protein product [Ceratitis capitata]